MHDSACSLFEANTLKSKSWADLAKLKDELSRQQELEAQKRRLEL